MARLASGLSIWLWTLSVLALLLHASPTAAFGAGNIGKLHSDYPKGYRLLLRERHSFNF